MARTAVVNPRKKRRKLYGAAAASHARKRGKRRRRNPASPTNRAHTVANPRRRYRRRRNPGYAMSNPRRRRRSNPSTMGGFDFDRMVGIIPAGVAGIQAARWATKLAGPFEVGAAGRSDAPGIKHGIAIALAAHFGGSLIGDLLGDADKGAIAEIAALSWGGDLFLHKRFWDNPGADSFAARNLYLGDDANYSYTAGMGADEFIDASGNRYVRTPQGWQLAGIEMGAGIETDQPLEPGTIVTDPNTGEQFMVAGDDTDRLLAGIEMGGVDQDLGSDYAYANFAGGSTGMGY